VKFPLELDFKTIALAPQVSVLDAAGELQLYVKQKAFRLKESVTVFRDTAQTRPLYRIEAERVFDISARYEIREEGGAPLGVVQRRGMRSLWRAHYEVHRGGVPVLTIREENPWIKVADALLGEVPILSFFTGYMLHPAYRVWRAHSEAHVLRVLKRPAFFEGHYTILQTQPQEPDEETLAVLGVLMMILLERRRG
jgi:hypothetical protein